MAQMTAPQKNMAEIQLVAIGSSAGGTEAISAILPQLPKDFPCVVIVQHILQGFAELFAQGLDRKCQMNVRVAKGGEQLKRGLAYIADSGAQMRVAVINGTVFTARGEAEKITGHCPSVNALFSSAAALGPAAIGVILTGMGTDGAEGLLRMRNAGSYTIGQDEQSSAVYGMPCAAYDNGSVIRQLPLNSIANELLCIARRRK